jgi:glyoxylase-like metal-dependent hydrolase (beta-lactamase superfamily II)
VPVTDARAQPLDLLHQGIPRCVGAYVVETDDGLALFDCGPASCLPALRRALAERGLALDHIRHVLLSHIHFDHAGAAGSIVREHPEVLVHVSEVGAPHVIDPSRLEASARRLYGEAFDELWGAPVAVPEANVRVVGDDVLGLACFPTPGHARHHVSYLHPDGTLYSGDAAGVRIAPGRFVLPPLPPPEVDLEAWDASIDEMERRAPERLSCIHFGVFEDVEPHLERLRTAIARWAGWIEHGMDEDAFEAAVRADIAATDPAEVEHYLTVVPAWHGFGGLTRYWRKRREATGA